MAFNFPNNPSTNDTHTIGDKVWIYTGTAWKMQNAEITIAGSASSYANSAFDAANSSSSYANSSFALANTNSTDIIAVGGYANSAFNAANNATDSWVRDAANSASNYANGAFTSSNIADQKAVTSGDYANSSYTLANTNSTTITTVGDYANSAFSAANNAVDTWVRDAANSGSSYANSAYGQANTATTNAAAADQKAITSGSYANSAFSVANSKASISYVDTSIANLVDSAPATLDTLNELAAALGDDPNFATTLSTTIGVVGGYANSAYIQANSSYDQANSNYTSAVTQLIITTPVFNYNIDQYTGDNPTIYVSGGETIVFDLNQSSSHPFAIRVSNGGSNYNTGLTHVDDDGTISTGSNAQGKYTGKLYWKIPFELIGSTYVYQCTNHSSMVGNIVIQPPVSFVSANTQLAFDTANSAGDYANSAYLAANNAVDIWVRDAANSASDYANSSFDSSNSASSYANGAFAAANNATDSWVRDASNSASSYANSAFDAANNSSGGSATYLAVSAYTRTYTGDNSTTDFTISSGYSASDLIVTENGVVQVPNIDYTVSSTTLTFNTAPTNTVTVQIRELGFNSPNDDYARDTANAASSYANSAYTTANTKLSASGGTLSGDLTINGNVTVSGCTATLTVTSFRTSDHVIDLGYGTTGTPTQNAGIRIIRGDETEVQLRWIEPDNHWEYTNNGTDYIKFGSESAEYYANAAFDVANSSSDYANSAFATANNAVDTWVRDAANSSSSYANSSFALANSAYALASAGGGGGAGGVSLGMLIALS